MSLLAWYTYHLVNETSRSEAYKIIHLVVIWTTVAIYGYGIMFICFTILRAEFSRTIVTIKPDGDQENPHCLLEVGPFNRRGRVIQL